jgi:hypothetical protein
LAASLLGRPTAQHPAEDNVPKILGFDKFKIKILLDFGLILHAYIPPAEVPVLCLTSSNKLY